MHGTRGTLLRRLLILTEFVAGAVAGTAVGVAVVAGGWGTGWHLFGIWLTGVCLNYLPLALYAVSFLRRDMLAAELQDVDVSAELRHYVVAQLWVAVPLLFVFLDLTQRMGRAGVGR